MLTAFQDTICAPATKAGGAVAIVRVSGPEALACVDAVVSLRRGQACVAPGYSLRYGSAEGLDDVLVSIFRAPHSYTGEDSAEISCHASSYIVSELLSRLCAAGCRMAEPGEFTQRAFLNGKMDLAQAESVADLIAADSRAAHDLAFKQLQGRYSSEFKDLRDQLLTLASLLELELDFSEEELEFADRSHLRALTEEALSRVVKLRDSYRLGNAVKTGVPVAIVGAPNAGKSTLLNALLGEDRAIVSPIAGTTRDTIEEVLVMDGVKFRFIDTAGLRETSDPVEKLGVERSLSKLRTASIVVSLVEIGEYHDGMQWPGCDTDAHLIKVLNKCDLGGGGNWPEDVILISAKTGAGMSELRRALISCSGLAENWEQGCIVTSSRHYNALCTAGEQLEAVLGAMRLGLPADLLAEHLRSAIASISGIIGEISTDQVLGEIFAKFCVG
ncbi:MAG: tRNA uridine-5-carboxymethylaminomethyl(34) synthesis GTPase MnmE, partial [Candidatus Cryptobacteroides sp.]